MDKEFLQKRLNDIEQALVQTQQKYQLMVGQKSELLYLIDQYPKKEEEPCPA